MSSRVSLGLLGCAIVGAVAGCLPGGTPGMALQARRPHALQPTLDELAHVEVPEGMRALLVVYPRTACSGSARQVIVDEAGTFFGAVGPGEAALLTVPARTEKVIALSNVDVTAMVGAWFVIDEVRVAPSPNGILFSTWRANARQCGSGHYADASVATKAELEAALTDVEIQWVEPRPLEGQAWLDANRKRMDQVLGRQKQPDPPAVVAHRYVP